MDLPSIPTLRTLESISPSFYNAALLCKARAGWQQFGTRGSLPSSTGTIIGSAFHAVMEAGNMGRFPAGEEGIRSAKACFDQEAARRLADAHPLVRVKFASPQKFPFFFERRARAVALAVRNSESAGTRTATAERPGFRETAAERTRLVEQSLVARDGLVKGRIDLWEKSSSTVTDYKSGYQPRELLEMTQDEKRQLRLYAHLAIENGYAATTATIVRADGRKASIAVSPAEAAQEGTSARQTLAQFNSAVGSLQSFAELASPSPANCAGCPCMALCEPFWQAARPEWEAECGTNVEGKIESVRDANFAGTPLQTLLLKQCRGSSLHEQLEIEQIPVSWLSLGSAVPTAGDVVRIISAARPPPQSPGRVLRVDRIKSTAIWKANPAQAA